MENLTNHRGKIAAQIKYVASDSIILGDNNLSGQYSMENIFNKNC